MSVYALKPRFQSLLRPLVAPLPGLGVTANAVTVSAAAGSLLVGGFVAWRVSTPLVFLTIPVWLFVRMALNAIDGMLAREFHQQSVLGGYLNEIGDVVSDAALYAPFALVPPFGWPAVTVVVLLSTLTELAGVLGQAIGASRRYDGPMGKSDRAVVFGALAVWVAIGSPRPEWMQWSVPLLLLLLALTCINRVRAGVAEAGTAPVRRR
jgi:CDP-diacylglycerol---glycerol-3-phosphate 3-phosphatidyltransferase